MGFTASMAAMAVSAGASVAGGIVDNSARKEEAKQYERNANLARIGADQEEVLRREDLLSTLSAINSIRVARGLDVSSPTGMAIADRTTMMAERGIGAMQLNARNQSQAFRTQAGISRSQGTMSLLSGFLSAGTTIAKGPGGGGWSTSRSSGGSGDNPA